MLEANVSSEEGTNSKQDYRTEEGLGAEVSPDSVGVDGSGEIGGSVDEVCDDSGC